MDTAELKRDFRNFLFVCYKHLNLEVDHISYEIAAYIQELYETKTSGMAQAMRGIGKSYVTSCFVPWVLWHNPNEKVFVVSAAKKKALEFIAMSQNLIMELDILQDLRPRRERGFDVKRQRWSANQFDVYDSDIAQAPSVLATSIDAKITGSRATLLIPDDIEDAKNSRTINQREKIKEAIKEFEAIRVPDSFEIWLGTPQSEDTVYTDITRHIDVRKWPALHPGIVEMTEKYPDISPSIRASVVANPECVGESVVPERFTTEYLEKIRIRNGNSWFQLHYMLDPTLSDADRYPLKLRDLLVTSLDKEFGINRIRWGRAGIIDDLACVGFGGDKYVHPAMEEEYGVRYNTVIMAVDPSGLGPDETGIAVVGELNGMLFLLWCEGLSGGYAENMQRIAELARDYKVNLIVEEVNFGDGMFGELLKPVMGKLGYRCPLEQIRFTSVQGRKEERIIGILEPIMNQHRLVVADNVILGNFSNGRGDMYDLFYQMSRITKEKGALKHDDRLDALSMAVYYYVSIVGKDVDVEARMQEDKLFNDAWENNWILFNAAGASHADLGLLKSIGAKRKGWIR